MSKFTPHDYQRAAMRHIHDEPRCALWMPMGGGKTVSTLTALDELALVEDVYPALVLAPLRVARSVWPQEIQKWDHLKHLRVSVITGSAAQRARALRADADIYCMNYENLVWLRDALDGAWPFKTVIADEFTRLKSFRITQGSKRAGVLGKYAHTSVQRFIGLTGTPAPNGLADLWGPIWFLDKGTRLGKSYSAFSERWFSVGYDGFSLKPRAGADEEIHEKLQDLCLTVTGLPVDEPIRNIIRVELPGPAMALYRDMEEEMFIELEEGGEVVAANSAVKTMKCLQLANGAVYLEGEGSEKQFGEIHKAKLEALDSIIEEANGAPVLVAYHFKSDLARLKKAFPRGRHLDANPKTIEDWNAGKIPLLFAHPASAGHGLNLAQGGNILVFFALNWNLEEHMQIIERIGPMRQAQAGLKRPVVVHYIAAKDTADELVLQRLEGKKSVQDILLEAMKRRR